MNIHLNELFSTKIKEYRKMNHKKEKKNNIKIKN